MFWEILPSLTIGVFFFAIIGFAYLATAKIYGHKLAVKATAQYLIALGILAAISYLASLWLSPTQIDIIWASIYVGFSLLFIILFVAHVKGRRQIAKEKIVLEISFGDNGFWLIVLGLLFLGSSFSSIRDVIAKSQFSNSEILRIILKFLAGAFALYIGIGKTILTENGILSLFGYAKWKQIKSYKWDDGKIPVLKLKVADSLLSLIWISVIIPNTHKATVQNLLAQELPNPEST
jgi:hypothetical protein